MKLFRDGDTRMLICMDAAGMGLDIPDIDIIIQWGVSSILTFSGWYQRGGRASCDPRCSGLFILYYQ